jgi:signal transduction histidine kinase/CheY-like chemotaxis protein
MSSRFYLGNLSKQSKTVLIGGFVLAVIVLFEVWDRQEELWFEQLKQDVLENTLILGGKLDAIEKELQGVLSLFNASTFVTDEEFETYVVPILKNNTYIQSLGWAPRISHSQSEFYEEKMATEGSPDFHITEQSEQGTLTQAQPREEYYPVHYVEPLKRNDALFGFDLGSIPSLERVIRESRDSGKIMASEKFKYLQDNQNNAGIFVFAPYYETKRIPLTLENRRQKLNGFLVGFYRVSEMMNQMVQPYQAKGINLVVYDADASAGNNKLYGELLSHPRREFKNLINFSNRNWFLVWQGSDEFNNGPKKASAWWIAGGVQVFAIFLAIIFEMMASRTRQVVNEVRIRTEELTQANDNLQLENEARSKAEKELHAAKEDAELANKAKSIFLANMSHEIRTPMNAILGYSQILKRNERLDPTQKATVENILRSGDHLLKLINDILNISKIEAGKMELHLSDFDLIELVHGISAMFQPRCQEKQIRWILDFPEESSIGVQGDEIKLKQVLINLLGNAVKFVDAGEITFRVVPETDDHFLFEVMDTGRGISREYQRSIFEPFHQEEDGAKKGGTGLGLAIAKKQVELMGGALTLDSEPGQGSRFAFTLLLPPANNPVVAAQQKNIKYFHLAEGIHVKALVVDDNEQNREVLSKILASTGIDVLTAMNGKEALKQVRLQSPDIIFMDLRMPVMNGFQALEALKEEFDSHDIKTVAISASAFEHQKESTLLKGFDDFIPKPFHIEDIFNCLLKLLDVEFIREEETPVANSENPLALAEIQLPEAILNRLKRAADLSSLTDLKACMQELPSLGDNGNSLHTHLQPLVGKYDMPGILTLLEKVTNGPDT